MNQPVTLEKALELNVLKYAQLPEKEREQVLVWVSNAASLSPYKNDREFNAALLPLLQKAERELQRREMPPMPTAQEHIQFWGGLGSGLAVLVLKVGGAGLALYLIGGAVVGGVKWLLLNGWIVGGALGLLFVAFVLSGLPKIRFGSSERQAVTEEYEEETFFYNRKWYKKTTEQ